MLLLKYVFVLLHITTAAAWFGLALRLAGQARNVVAAEPAAATALAADGAHTVRLLGVFSVLTFVFAFVTFSVGIAGGTDYGWPYHTALLLILGLIGVSFGIIRPAWAALQGGDAGAQKRVAMGTGIGHTLWLVILIMMYWTSFSVAISSM